MTPQQAIEILENKTGYAIHADDCDKDTVVEAIQMALDTLKEKAKRTLSLTTGRLYAAQRRQIKESTLPYWAGCFLFFKKLSKYLYAVIIFRVTLFL